MASASLTASLRSRCIFIYCIVFFGSIQHVVCYTPALIKVKCRDTVDLRGMNLDSGLIVSELPERIPIYPHEDQRCDIFLSFAEGNQMMFYFDDLDLYSSDRSKCDSTNIQFFDGSASVGVQDLDDHICGRRDDSQMPTGVYYVLHNLLIIRTNSNGVVQGSGFKIHFTIYRRGFPCAREEFSCESYDEHSGSQGFRRCVDRQLVCDEWNDCGDWADEKQNCNDLTGGAVAAIVLVSVGLLALIVGLIIFCKIRRQREIKHIGEKEASAVMRDTSFTSSRGGAMLSPFSISNETLEKDRYIPRYSTGRNSARRGGPGQGPGPLRAPHYVEDPPPYSEKPSQDDSRSYDGPGFEDYEGRPRSRQKRRGDPEPDEVFEGEEEEEPPRMRRGRSRSQEGRAPPPPREDRYPPRDDRPPSRRDDRDSPRSDRYSRDRDDRRPPRDDRYPSRRDDSPPGRRDDRDRPGRYDDRDRDRPGRYDDRDRDRDRPPSRYDDRDRERPPSRHDQRDRDRERDRERPPYEERDRERDAPRRERPPSRRSGPPEERPHSSGPEDDMLDQLHPLREQKRRSMHSDSDPDASREGRRTPRDRSPYDDRHQPSRDDREPRPRDSGHRQPPRDDLHPPRGREDRSSPRGSDREDRPPQDRDDREDRPPRDRDDRPRDRNGRGPRDSDRPGNGRARDEPRSQHRPPSRTPDDSYEDVEFRGRPPRKDSPREEDPADSPPRNRRRRSRSRDGQDRPRSSRPADDDRRQNASYGGYKEESV